MSAAAPLPPPYPNGGPLGFNDPRSPSAHENRDRAFAHIHDLQALAREGYNPLSSISSLLETAERGLNQARTLNELRRPDLAFVEFLRVSEIAANVIPHHKDYTHFTIDQPERAQKLMLLQKKVNTCTEQYMNIKTIIVNNNARAGTRPQRGQNGHVRTESAPAAQQNTNGYAVAPLEVHKIRPTPSPKPEKLHGRAIPTATAGANGLVGGPPDILSDRFAKLRMPSIDTTQRQDTRVSSISSTHSSPISRDSVADYANRNSFDALSRTASVPSRPQGPRGMPNGALAPIQIPNLPQEPSAVYSPARNMQTTGNIDPPRHTLRSLASTSSRRTPASSVSSYAPNGSSQSGDYFPSSAPSSNGTPPAHLPRRASGNAPHEAFVSAEKLYDLLNKGFNILLIDFRSRQEFDEGHIYARNIICVDPLSVRPGMSAEDLGDTLVLSPEYEQTLFDHRSEYDEVVYYDNDTQAPYPFRGARQTQLKYLHEALFDFNQEKPLAQPPILLRRGIEGWRDLVGTHALAVTDTVAKVKAGRSQGIQRRPLATTSMSGNSQLRVPKRRLRNYEQFDEEEEQGWRERARAESVVLPQTPGVSEDGQAGDPDDNENDGSDAIREFIERFPEANDIDRTAFKAQLPNRAPPEPPAKVPLASYPPRPPPSAYPSVPARPQPAAPRMSYTGVSDRAVSSTTPATRTASNQMAPYIPPKFLAANLRMPKTGLVNFGATCYMNSTLQAMSATTPLSIFFMDDAFRSQLQRDSWKSTKGVMSELYANLIRSLWKGDVECIRPTTFRNFCRRISDTFNNDNQQDAKEFFDFLLDTLHEDLNVMWARTPLRALTPQEEAKRERMPKLIVARTEWGRYVHRELSFITGLFAGQHASKLTCLTCGFTSTTYEAFTSISVEIPPQQEWSTPRMPTLQDCLRSYCAEERLTRDDEWHCTRCNTTREAAKRITLTRAPQYLVVHFKRFATQGRTARKVRIPVDFPLNDLDLGPYMLPQPTAEEAQVIARDYGMEALKADSSMTPPYRYDAYAVVRHIGQTMQSGHYVTAAKDPARKCWFWYNDKLVDPFYPEQQVRGSSKDLRSEEAYIVFYQRSAPSGYGGKM